MPGVFNRAQQCRECAAERNNVNIYKYKFKFKYKYIPLYPPLRGGRRGGGSGRGLLPEKQKPPSEKTAV